MPLLAFLCYFFFIQKNLIEMIPSKKSGKYPRLQHLNRTVNAVMTILCCLDSQNHRPSERNFRNIFIVFFMQNVQFYSQRRFCHMQANQAVASGAILKGRQKNMFFFLVKRKMLKRFLAGSARYTIYFYKYTTIRAICFVCLLKIKIRYNCA